MTRYLISFPDGAMDIPDEELPEVSEAAHAVVQAARDAGVWITGAGVEGHDVSVVATNGTVENARTTGHIGGFAIVDVPSRKEALAWAARFAVACRCTQEVRELMHDPSV